ncbi:hypothetical protein HYH03_017895 [Edaphochlamys debaryana]|uniref:Uncharacterized protein n=1 Tax=Edaphochlamys debaryana TaxID=47281 RepID=A0A836BQ49_9CHLO|nr:hypothetical protein HYH03_017895 [Edaphochlamys debaryana]|eukprot:KAG2483238.1 hypothetical protein HYH03_017895 [Edaphochlamys debaryana]
MSAIVNPSPRRQEQLLQLSSLQDENASLRVQCAKLQVALRNMSKRSEGTGPAAAATAAPAAAGSQNAAFVSAQQMESVMGELSALRQQVAQLHHENKSLQAQLHEIRDSRVASDDEPWTSAPGPGPRPGPLSRGDMAFIEQEILSLKHKLSETRSKLRTTDPDGTPPGARLGRGGSAHIDGPPVPASVRRSIQTLHNQMLHQQQAALKPLSANRAAGRASAAHAPLHVPLAYSPGAHAQVFRPAGPAAPFAGISQARNRAAAGPSEGPANRKLGSEGGARQMKENRANASAGGSTLGLRRAKTQGRAARTLH